MALSNHDQGAARQYLLGLLTDEAEEQVEQRLLTDDDFFAELEITKDELVEEYLANQLTEADHQRFERKFLASPEGKQSLRFAGTLTRYISNHPAVHPKKMSWVERFSAFWNAHRMLLRAATAIAAIVIVVGIVWFARAPQRQSFASLALTMIPSTRSTGAESPKINLKGRGLRLVLTLPPAASPAARYRVGLTSDKGVIRTSEVAGQNSQSISVEFPAAELERGEYAVTLWTVSADGAAQRIPGSYYFTVE